MNTVFMVSKLGTSFATRTRAEEIVRELEDVLATGAFGELTVNMTGVRVISPSFAAAFIKSLHSLLNRPRFQKESISIVGDSPQVQARLQEALEQYRSYYKKARPLDRVLVG